MRIAKKEAIKLLGLEPKQFENYFRVAKEFDSLPREGRGRFYFDEEALKKWLSNYQWRTVNLGLAEYAICLDFALAQHFRNYVNSDFGSGRQREFGQKVSNWVKGQLGEVAVQVFLSRLGVDVDLDFDIREGIVPQDIVGVKENGDYREPRISVGIKSTKPKSGWLILMENEIELLGRHSDVYILTRTDLPDDHLLKAAAGNFKELLSGQKYVETYEGLITPISGIPSEIAGWCYAEDLRKVDSIPGQDFDGSRYVIESGSMKKSPEEWRFLASLL